MNKNETKKALLLSLNYLRYRLFLHLFFYWIAGFFVFSFWKKGISGVVWLIVWMGVVQLIDIRRFKLYYLLIKDFSKRRYAIAIIAPKTIEIDYRIDVVRGTGVRRFVMKDEKNCYLLYAQERELKDSLRLSVKSSLKISFLPESRLILSINASGKGIPNKQALTTSLIKKELPHYWNPGMFKGKEKEGL